MKKFLFLTIPMILIFISCSNNEYNDIHNYNLKGQVKKITETKYKAIEKYGNWEKGELLSNETTTEFNRAGYITKIELISEFGGLTRWTHKYSGDTCIETNYIYDADGQLSAYGYSSNKNPTITKITRKYSGDLVTEEHLDENDKLQNIIKIEIENDRIVREFQYNKFDKLSYEVVQSYYSNGDLKEYKVIMYQKENTDTLYYFLEYLDKDNFGNWIENLSFDDNNEYIITERSIEYYE